MQKTHEMWTASGAGAYARYKEACEDSALQCEKEINGGFEVRQSIARHKARVHGLFLKSMEETNRIEKEQEKPKAKRNPLDAVLDGVKL